MHLKTSSLFSVSLDILNIFLIHDVRMSEAFGNRLTTFQQVMCNSAALKYPDRIKYLERIFCNILTIFFCFFFNF